MLDLLKKRSYLPLFLTQFFGAFNDNAFKLAMLTLISYHITKTQGASEFYQAIAGALFIFPFFIFSAMAGQIADRLDKSLIARWIKLFELILMGFGGLGLYYQNIWILFIVLTGMGIHSTFFGPIKYAILPDHLAREELMGATALIEGSTFIAILLGTTLGTLAIGDSSPRTPIAIILTLLAATIGFVSSFFIPKTPPHQAVEDFNWHLWDATKQMILDVTKNYRALPAILAISWFWLIGGVMLTKLPDYIHYVLNANSMVFALFLALFSIGIAIGSVTISAFLQGRIIMRYVPYCMMLLSIFAYDLYAITPQNPNSGDLYDFITFLTYPIHIRIIFDFLMFSFCCGLFTVPLYAYLQVCADELHRARIIAVNNVINAFFMVIGAILVMILVKLSIGISTFFVVLAALNLIASAVLWFYL